SGVPVPIEESFCLHMANGLAPNLTNDAAAHPVYGALAAQSALGIGSYLGMPLRIPDGRPFGSLCAVSHSRFAFTMSHRDVLATSALLLSRLVNRERSAIARRGECPSMASTLGLELGAAAV
ncbi:MAG TPA: GAF domain-containing protein, partial [Solirubrobacteraceae bacterium]|nr:GAF domain-containing protein [Solirubrobacteraceae bacterium]